MSGEVLSDLLILSDGVCRRAFLMQVVSQL